MSRLSTTRIVIAGWYGNKNLGDEAQLSAMVGMIRCNLPGVEITVLSDSPEATRREHGVESIKRGNWITLRQIREIARAELLIVGGGTLLYDWGRGGASVVGWLSYAIVAKLVGTPVMYFNGGVGLIYNRISKHFMKHVCNSMDLITVRDELSRDVLTTLGVTKTIHVGADSAFALSRQATVMAGAHQKRTLSERPQIGVNVRYWIYQAEEVPFENWGMVESFGGSAADFMELKKDVAVAIDYLKREMGATVTFFPISFLRKEGDYDVELAEEVVELLDNQTDVTIIREECSYTDLLAQMRGFELVVCRRLHALVFAAILNIPMLAVSYDSKVDALMKLLGQEEYLVSSRETTREALCQKLSQLWERREAISRHLEETAPKLAREAEKSVELMTALIDEKRSRVRLVFEGIILAIRVTPWLCFHIIDSYIMDRLLRIVR